jgi:hypothetical protein
MQESSLRLRVVRQLRRDKSFEAIEGSAKSWNISSDSRRQRFGSQLIKSRKESLVHFVNVSRRRRQMVRILWRGFLKSRQPSDPPEERGGYGYVWSLSSRDCEPLDQPIVTRQSSGSTGVAQDLSPREQRENPEKTSGIWSSGFIQVKGLEFAFGKSPRFDLNRPSLGCMCQKI